MNFDESVLYFFNQTLANPLLDIIMIGVTTGSLIVMPLIGVVYFLWGSRRVGKTLLWTLVVSGLLTGVFYYLAFRPRPEDVQLLLPTPPFPSFPSGHSAMAFGLATAWALIGISGRKADIASERAVPETENAGKRPSSRARVLTQTLAQLATRIHPLAIVVAYLIASLIAVSRLYLGHHHPSDVIAGAVLGCAVGAAMYGLIAIRGTLVERIRWLLWPQVAVAILVTMMAYLDVLPIHLLRFPFSDKILHFLLFGLVTFWLQLWLQNRKVGLGKIGLPLSIIVPLTLALIEEGFQAFSPLRTASLVDLGADAAGMIFFYGMAQKLLHWNGSPRSSKQEWS